MDQNVASLLDNLAARESPSPRLEPWYNAAGDCLNWYFCEDESYRCRIDDKLTIYKSLENDSLVGCQIKGVTALAAKFGSFGIEVHSKTVRLAVLFLVSQFDAMPEEGDLRRRQEIYQDLLRRAGDTEVELPIAA